MDIGPEAVAGDAAPSPIANETHAETSASADDKDSARP
jgi:hypothetical protein